LKEQIALLIDLQKIDQDIKTLNSKKQTWSSRPGRMGWRKSEAVSRV
jgi:hypothetical protein